MKLFISWSGSRSRAMAEALRVWLPRVIQSVDAWVSLEAEKGTRWSAAVSAKLEETDYGIVCLTRENLGSSWIAFEAGALAKNDTSRVCTFLVDLNPADVPPPLGLFQHTLPGKEDVFRLLQTLNAHVERSGDKSLSPADLLATFEAFWPSLEAPIADAQRDADLVEQRRGDRELLEEILEHLRHSARASNAQEIAERAAMLAGQQLLPRILDLYSQTTTDARNRTFSYQVQTLTNRTGEIYGQAYYKDPGSGIIDAVRLPLDPRTVAADTIGALLTARIMYREMHQQDGSVGEGPVDEVVPSADGTISG